MAEQSLQLPPRLWSDFDGTAVGLVPKRSWRNWTKYPLPMVEGYAEFLGGVQKEGVEIAGIVSRRPNIRLRRFVTARSVSRLGLGDYFPDETQIVLVGSELSKAEHIISKIAESKVGIIDDKPHKLGMALVNVLASTLDINHVTSSRDVFMGAVSHEKTDEYITRLAEGAAAQAGVEVTDRPDGIHIAGVDYSILVTQLEPYGEAAGRSFATTLMSS